MNKSAVLVPMALALGAIVFAPRPARANAQQEGPIEIQQCQTIDQPGSYKLVNNLTLPGPLGACLEITTDFVSVDLAGFTISGPAVEGATGIDATVANRRLQGIKVGNGSISGFGVGLNLTVADGSIVEGFRIAQSLSIGMEVGTAIVRGNTAVNITGTGIVAAGIVSSNFSSFNQAGFVINSGSTAIGNTATNNQFGMLVDCPSNLTDNTIANNGQNLLIATGCNNTNNVAP